MSTESLAAVPFSSSSGARLVALDLSSAFRTHSAFIFRVLRSLGVEAQMLDDGVQEVFLVAMRRWHSYDQQVPVRSWLFGIARRVASHQRRSRRRQLRREKKAVVSSGPPAPDRHHETRVAVDFVQAFCDELPLSLREVFVSIQLEGLTAPEAAQVLGVNVNTVYSRLRRARKMFTAAVDEKFGDSEDLER